jgi:hypothetical protein
MAQKVQVLLVDDVDGSEASESVSFGFDGTTYELDLNEKNAPEAPRRASSVDQGSPQDWRNSPADQER